MSITKIIKLQSILSEMKRVVIAFSGGVDSAFLLKIACETIGSEQVLAVTADSPSLAREDLEATKQIAAEIGANHRIIQTQEFEDENYLSNPARRCYFCKKELFTKMVSLAQQDGFPYVAAGYNADDPGDFRPGLGAVKEFQIRNPLQDASFTKAEIRGEAKKMNLTVWDKPANACLSSRLPYGTRVSLESLRKIEEAEGFIKGFLGVRQVRVRHYGEVARIELFVDDIAIALEGKNFAVITGKLQELGYTNISLDLKGYKSGNLNEVLKNRRTERVLADVFR